MFDIVVIGAGPVGATLALALADADLNLVLVDSRAHDEAGRSERTLALSHGARLIFERVGIWGPLAATRNAVTPIVEVDVSQAQAFGATRLTAADAGVPALGYVVSYRALQAALDAALARRAIPVRFGATAERVGGTPAYAAVTLKDYADAITARLAVVADGVAANVEGIERDRRPYDQTAIVAPVWPRAPHGGVAFERFRLRSSSPVRSRRREWRLSATRHSRCIRSRGRASIWGCAMPSSFPVWSSTRPKMRSAIVRCSIATSASGEPIAGPASRSRTGSCTSLRAISNSSAGRAASPSRHSTHFPRPGVHLRARCSSAFADCSRRGTLVRRCEIARPDVTNLRDEQRARNGAKPV